MRARPLIEEAAEKHRQIKHQLLVLMEKCDNPRITNAKIKDELFKLYQQIK